MCGKFANGECWWLLQAILEYWEKLMEIGGEWWVTEEKDREEERERR